VFELWGDSPFRVFRLFKYVAGPPAVAFFVLLAPILWALPRRRFRPAAIAVSLFLLAFSSGITFTAIFVAAAFGIWRLSDAARRAPALAVLAGFELVSAAVFHLPWRLLPVYRDPRLASVYPGLLTDRELFFYLGLAFPALRALHLSLRQPGERPSFARVLLYLAWAPTYRIGPFVAFDEFDRDADRAGGMPPRREVLAGLAEAVFGGIVFEAVIAGIDRAFFRRLGPDDGSYWYYWFFDRPPQSRLLTLVGVVLVALRYYLLLKAYCHVARGASRMAGIPLPRSMRWPLLSTDVASFWRRYNVTVSRFTEDHVLKPVAAMTRPAVAVAAAFLFMGLWHRPAWHTAAWGIAQIAGIAIWWEWRSVKRRSGALRRSLGRVPRPARASVAIALTLAFVAATVPLLLDLRHGGARVYRRLLGREGPADSFMIARTSRRAIDLREDLHQHR
jgi:D-alanyl-lipoteichoic acid acyltransferase DltB (MBOAT superfamily)